MSLRVLALTLAATLLGVSGFLIFQRGGSLAWTGLVIALLLSAKVWFWHSSRDPVLVTAVLVQWSLAWAIVWQYVKSQWESGEVVQITVDTPSGQHTARVWVLDLNEQPTMYYDAPPRIAQHLLDGARIAMSRDGVTMSKCADATRVADASDELLTTLLTRMEVKYHVRNEATRIFYSVLGGEKNRVPVLLRLTACGSNFLTADPD